MRLTEDQIIELLSSKPENPILARAARARVDFAYYTKLIYPENKLTTFHEQYYKVLEKFAEKKIKNLIVSVPSQHGKSTGSSMLLPSYILGQRPETRIAIGSYSDTFAQRFNRAIQRIIDSENYSLIFPGTTINSKRVVTTQNWLRNSHEFEIVDNQGGLVVVGRGGGISGRPVDVFIFDDLYKDAAEGNSPTIRDSVIEWYESAAQKRLHNDSQQLVVFTRWHEEDLIGYFEKNENVVEVGSIAQIEKEVEKDPNVWIKINYEAIKESEPTELDPRQIGEALWEEKHSLEKHKKERSKNIHMFNCMSQGRPGGTEGLLFQPFKTYKRLPDTVKKANYTDTADTGDDYLASGCYEEDFEGNIYLTDLVYSQERFEETENMVSKMLMQNNTRTAYIESNNGGRGFARNVEEKTIGVSVEWFHQSKNKESRILTNSSDVNKILMPEDWADRWPQFYLHVTKYKRLFRANKFDDAVDMLTGIVEKSREPNYQIFARTN